MRMSIAKTEIKEKIAMKYVKSFNSILDVIHAEFAGEPANWIADWAMDSRENTQRVAEFCGYTIYDEESED